MIESDLFVFCAGDCNWPCVGRNQPALSVMIDLLGFCVGGGGRN